MREAWSLGLCEHPVNEYKSLVVTRVLHDFYAADPKRGFYGGGGLDSRMDYYPAGFALDRTSAGRARLGAGVEEEIEPVLHAYHRNSGALDLSRSGAEQHLARR